MIKASLFWDTVDTLSYALHCGIIRKGCSSCDAMGVLIAHANQIKFRKDEEEDRYFPRRKKVRLVNGVLIGIEAWIDLFRTTEDSIQYVNKGMLPLPDIVQDDCLHLDFRTLENVLALIHTTQRDVDQLRRIEYAFETHTYIQSCLYPVTHPILIRDDLRSGVMAVLDQLFDIHEVGEQEEKDRAIMGMYQRDGYTWRSSA